jgi:hypothetical protein
MEFARKMLSRAFDPEVARRFRACTISSALA